MTTSNRRLQFAYCLIILSLGVSGAVFYYFQNHSHGLGGSIALPKLLWLSYALWFWYFLPVLIASDRRLSRQLRQVYWVFWLNMVLRAIAELWMMYVSRNWHPYYGIGHDLFSALLIFALLFREEGDTISRLEDNRSPQPPLERGANTKLQSNVVDGDGGEDGGGREDGEDGEGEEGGEGGVVFSPSSPSPPHPVGLLSLNATRYKKETLERGAKKETLLDEAVRFNFRIMGVMFWIEAYFAWYMLRNVHSESGPVYFVPGSHEHLGIMLVTWVVVIGLTIQQFVFARKWLCQLPHLSF